MLFDVMLLLLLLKLKKRHLWKIEELGGHIFTAVNLGKISNLCASLYITTNRDVRPTNTTQRPCTLVVENASKKGDRARFSESSK